MSDDTAVTCSTCMFMHKPSQTCQEFARSVMDAMADNAEDDVNCPTPTFTSTGGPYDMPSRGGVVYPVRNAGGYRRGDGQLVGHQVRIDGVDFRCIGVESYGGHPDKVHDELGLLVVPCPRSAEQQLAAIAAVCDDDEMWDVRIHGWAKARTAIRELLDVSRPYREDAQ